MGLRLRLARDRKGLSQEALGERVGVGATTIQAWEIGRNNIDIVALGKAVKDLGVSTDFVILGDFGGVRADIALELQALQRRYLDTPPTKRGPKPKAATTPLVRDLPEPTTSQRSHALHQPGDTYVPPPKRTSTHGA
jgi:transcriptional regulator with XRE-family HTH domain